MMEIAFLEKPAKGIFRFCLYIIRTTWITRLHASSISISLFLIIKFTTLLSPRWSVMLDTLCLVNKLTFVHFCFLQDSWTVNHGVEPGWTSKRESKKCMIRTTCQKQPPRLFSKISVLFFQEHLFLEFSRRRYVFTEQMPIFQEGLSVHRTDTIFPGALFMCSSNRYRFSRSTFLATEQIPIFQEPSLCVHRTDTNFPGAPF